MAVFTFTYARTHTYTLTHTHCDEDSCNGYMPMLGRDGLNPTDKLIINGRYYRSAYIPITNAYRDTTKIIKTIKPRSHDDSNTERQSVTTMIFLVFATSFIDAPFLLVVS